MQSSISLFKILYSDFMLMIVVQNSFVVVCCVLHAYALYHHPTLLLCINCFHGTDRFRSRFATVWVATLVYRPGCTLYTDITSRASGGHS